ncbi:unnamed protein product, partial [Coccothraustes coccothraustes]
PPPPAWEHPASTSPRRHRQPLELKYSPRWAAEGKGEQVSAGCTCAFPCLPSPFRSPPV